MTKIPCYLIDIDGTVADPTHRLHFIQPPEGIKKNWDAFFAACVDDMPIEHMCELVRGLIRDRHVTGIIPLFISGRSDQYRHETRIWLDNQHLMPIPLYMRRAGDFRPDYIIKAELLAVIKADNFQPVMAFDDRAQVVKMWRENGIPCAQVAEGNF